MAMSSGDFIEARKVSLSTLGEEKKKKKVIEEVDLEEETELPGEDEMEYIPTSEFLNVRNVAFATMDDEEKFANGKLEEPVNVNEKLYAQAIEGKEAVEREKKQALLDNRG